MNVRISTEEGTVKMRWVQSGRFFSVPGGSTIGDIYEGKADYATRDGGPFQARFWYIASISNMGFATGKDSTIKTPYDIAPGTRIIELSGFGGAAVRQLNTALLAWGNLTPDDVEFVPAGSFGAQVMFLMEGKGDIAIMVPQAPYSFEVEASPGGLAWINMNAEEDPAAAKRYTDIWPTFGFSAVEMGVPSAIDIHMMANPTGYIVRADADTELVYNMTKWMAENYDRYKDGHPALVTATVDNLLYLAEHAYTPLHDGTVKYLKEIGRWTPAHEKRQQENIALISRYVEAYETAIDTADDQGIRVSPQNEAWIELWENYKKELGLPKFQFFGGLD